MRDAIERAAAALIREQRGPASEPRISGEDRKELGGWEGEVVWCPMLAAQYVLLAYALGVEIAPQRRAGLLRHFERTRLESGLWGLHELSAPYLFVTTLVYVAARLLGLPRDAPLLAPARDFLAREGVLGIPSWGKLWLALLGLYDWRGVPPIVPELWALPRWLPVHPSKYYCHTRHIYLAMSILHGRKYSVSTTPLLDEIRAELHPEGMDSVDWPAARRMLRPEELVTPPGPPLRILYRLLGFFDRHHLRGPRRRLLQELEERIRWELRTTDHTSLSPVSGFLNVLALRSSGRDDPDAKRALERVSGWMWEDEDDGLRIAGARSASWDTAFAVQALAAAAPHVEVEGAISRGVDFLRSQQIRESFPGHREAFRIDPRGGWCFASIWHGWPVSDCTAEALEALLAGAPGRVPATELSEAVRFMLRCQNRDGGFGSYEARRSRLGLEWLNPAEMFGDSMTEHSYVECTASCLSALAIFREHHPEILRERVQDSIGRAEARLRAFQRRDGAWRGVWGVHHVYGTLFGIRGLVAAGAKPRDPALRRACRWLHERQRADGGWGEDAQGCRTGGYVAHAEGQVVQTAWALLGLLSARDPDWDRLSRGARFLLDRQEASGGWPRQDPVGLFFRTALLDYVLYRAYFPLWALSLYQSRSRQRETFSAVPELAS